MVHCVVAFSCSYELPAVSDLWRGLSLIKMLTLPFVVHSMRSKPIVYLAHSMGTIKLVVFARSFGLEISASRDIIPTFSYLILG